MKQARLKLQICAANWRTWIDKFKSPAVLRCDFQGGQGGGGGVDERGERTHLGSLGPGGSGEWGPPRPRLQEAPRSLG